MKETNKVMNGKNNRAAPQKRKSKPTHKAGAAAAGGGVLPLPKDNPDGPGAMGRAVKIDNPEPAVKKLIDEGWQKNAFNQYVSDMISVHRTLPDPRDEW